MAITVDWGQRIINVPQADLTLVGTDPTTGRSIYSFDTDAFRLALKDLEDDPEGMAFPDTHSHNTEVVLSGVTYARIIEIINGYRVTFEDGNYAVLFSGSNNNIADVTTVNLVSIRPNNSAGQIVVDTGSDDPRIALIVKLLRNKVVMDPDTGEMIVYDDNSTDVLMRGDVFEDKAGTKPYATDSVRVDRRERMT